MAEISRVALFGKLNSFCYRAVDNSAVFCKLRGNPYVELSHWFHQLLQATDSDLVRIIKHFNLDTSAIANDLTQALDSLPRGSTSITDLSSQIEETVERAWVYGSLMFGGLQIRSGFLIIGMLKTANLRYSLHRLSKQFEKIKIDALCDDFDKIVAHSPEGKLTAHDGGSANPGESSDAISPAAMGKKEALNRYTVDLTEQARSGKMDPIYGRDEEIRQMIDILMRRRQNNPILTGEAGVGKTAVVEGFAQRIVAGDVPPALRNISLRALDVGLLQAGASMKGEFENRLRQVIEEVQSSEKPVILFIDEAHTLVGAGGAAGTGDAANLLKPALARGTLRTVAATTWSEYKKHIEKDPALTRRFQIVQVLEPSEDKALLMMRGIVSTLEKHHQVQILDEALAAAVKLSHRYIPARQLPDKAISLIDTACARVAISQHATPPEVDNCQKAIKALEIELEIIEREQQVGIDVAERRLSAQRQLDEEKSKLVVLEQRWTAESDLVTQILALRARIRQIHGTIENDPAQNSAATATNANTTPVTIPATTAPTTIPATTNVTDSESNPGTSVKSTTETTVATGDMATESAVLSEASDDTTALIAELKSLQAALLEIQGEMPLILPTVDEQAVAAVVQDWTGIPVGRMVKNEIENVLNLADILGKRIIGQQHALEMICRRIQTSRARLDNESKPIGVFMLAGSSGVGKTETALALAEALYGGEQNAIIINMSEYQEAHTVSTLKGAPPGYVGYGEGGVLTEAVRRQPYSIILLDEVEKAHPDVHEIFFQVFDKGWMEDGEGRVIDFKNTIILLTTNVGTETIMDMCHKDRVAFEEIAMALRTPLLQVFPAALLGRLVTIPYYPLDDDMIKQIIRLQLGRIEKRISNNYGVTFSYDEAVTELIASRCQELESGGRMIDTILTNALLPKISTEFLQRMMENVPIGNVSVSVDSNEFKLMIA